LKPMMTRLLRITFDLPDARLAVNNFPAALPHGER
jgi:hypothetical protein